MTTLPALFISHGSPMTALDPREAGAFMQRLGPAIDRAFGRPTAVLAVSAHTLARRHVLLAGARHEAVYDFGGFPDALYRLRYDAPGAPALAPRVAALMDAAGLPVQTLDAGGLDHGIWTPLRYLYPDADVPVLPLSFSPHDSPAALMALGRALAPLADEGVLVIGSGSLTHNLRLIYGPGGQPAIEAPETAETAAFRRWVAERSAARDWAALRDYRQRAPYAAHMHPTDEHWLPFYVAAGAGGESATPQRLHASLTYGVLAMDLYAFGPNAATLAAETRDPVAA
ncbi:MAG: dioxygenase [Burkholderiaceae bacterium]|nr:dioxygenase [Burkholderiaceae bacterium]